MAPRYTSDFKEVAIKKALLMKKEERATLTQIANTLGISRSCLHNWIEKASNVGDLMERAKGAITPREWSKEQRIEAVKKAAKMSSEEIALYCRENGLYQHNLLEWEKEIELAYLKTAENSSSRSEVKELKEALKTCQKELDRKEKALAEAAAIIILKKKLAQFTSALEDS